jgi:hypothetical protein
MTVDGSHTMFLFKTHLFSLIYVFSGRLVRSREILRLRSDYRSLSMWWVKYELKIDNDINNKGYALVNWNPHPPPVPGHSGGFDKKPKQMRSKPPAPGAYFWVKTPSPWGTILGQTPTCNHLMIFSQFDKNTSNLVISDYKLIVMLCVNILKHYVKIWNKTNFIINKNY